MRIGFENKNLEVDETMGNNRQALVPDRMYHLYHHANGAENLFRTNENYRYFLQRYAEYVSLIAETFSYCLLPNHYHFLIRLRSEDEILNHLDPKNLKRKQWKLEDTPISTILANQIGTFQNAYAKTFNKQYERVGRLFRQSFGRKEIKTDDYFTNVIHYIHANAVHHGFVKNILDWDHTSSHSFLTHKTSKLMREEVFDWFGGKEQFIVQHKRNIDEHLALEMEDF